MTLLEFIFAVLVTWRVARLLVKEDGPGLIFHRVRRLLGAKVDPTGEWYGEPGSAGDWITCIACLSVSVALGVVVIHYFGGFYWLMPLAVSAGAMILNDRLGRGS